MNTNDRNVRLQQHVLLLNVMEHAEDLIKKNLILTAWVKNISTGPQSLKEIHSSVKILYKN
jgi:hypothetical protein